MATKMNGKKWQKSGVSSKTMTSSAVKYQQKSKKVEVRWLQNEAELYLKQWQRRYHQLEGIDGNYHQLSHHFLSDNQLEEYDDWCLTAQRILDLDLELIDNQNNSNNNINNNISNKLVNNSNGYDLFWRRDKSKLMFTFGDDSKSNDSAVGDDEEDVEEGIDDREDDFEAVENICCPGGRDSKRFTALKSFVNHNCSDNESNNGFYRNIIANKKDIMQENENKFTLELNKKLELLSEESSSLTPILKSRLSKPRPRDRNRSRPRPPPIRRQVFKCEHPGCSYQSDRNFNFLRHKRTHRKPISDNIEANDDNSSKTKPIINSTSNLSDHNISDNEDCDESVSSHLNSNSINDSSNNTSANDSLLS